MLGVLFKAHAVELLGTVGFSDPFHEFGSVSLLAFRLLAGYLSRHGASISKNLTVKTEFEIWQPGRAGLLAVGNWDAKSGEQFRRAATCFRRLLALDPAYNSGNAMIAENSDPEALTAQADIHRFFVKVIQPALAEFVPTDDIVGVETTDMEVFFENARVNTHNALCHEMRRSFALIIGALFERQLRSWLSGKMPTETKKVEDAKFPDLVKLVDVVDRSIGTESRITDLEALWSVANAVRHGNGPTAAKLLNKTPQLWNQARMKPDLRWQSDLVGNMRISDAQLEGYVRAVIDFWHSAGASSVKC